MLPDEEYKVVAYNTTNDLSLKEISVDYDMINYYPDEISFNLIKEEETFICEIKNNGERNLYPSQVIFFTKDDSGRTIQNTIEYAGCFNDNLVIKPNKTLKTDEEQGDMNGLLLNKNKPIIIRYSDIEFREVTTKFFE